MARIELTVSEELLDFIDDYAGRGGESRDEFLLRAIDERIDRCHARLRKEIQDLRASHPPLDLGGKTAAELIREGRDSR